MIDLLWIKWNRILAAIVLVFSFLIYFMTMSPTVSFWDCGEFIATSYTLGVPHPPGSPLYLIIGRIFSMLPFNDDIAFRVNMISPIVSAVAVMLLYLIIVKFAANWRGGINNKSDAVIAFGGALVGSLTFAFTDSHWFNAVEAEVYAMSTFFTVIVAWLILHWAERADKPGNERYILIIAYILGLATGVHILNLLALPFIALIIYFKKLPFNWKTFLITTGITGFTFLVIHNGIIKGLPKLAVLIGLTGVCISVLIVFGAMIWAIKERKKLLSIIFTSIVLILIGYSSYTIIFIRSGQDPVIDENDPETIASAISYLEREQYGAVGRFPRRYKGLPPQHEVVGYPKNNGDYSASQNKKYMLYNSDKQWSFFWNYQVKKMYWRYFLWQFAGRGESTDDRVTAFGANTREDGVDWTQFGFPFALILGVGGMFYHFYRDEKQAFSLFTLFFMTGLAIIVYLNQDNPQPRERDYSYVGSFLAFSVWVGIGGSAILEKCLFYIKSQPWRHHFAYFIIVLQLMLVPFVMLRANYKEHDRSGNFVAWDMSYNMLQSCETDGIIFTNGDNDTFPLWYLQEVEGIRKDVTVANLSLLNTAWYIKQLRDVRPPDKQFIFLDDKQINALASNLTRWKTRNVTLPYDATEKQITWKVKPTYGGQALKVQDVMIMQIINDTKWKYPIYFAVTVSPSNKIGLDNYLAMEGLTFKLNDHKVDNIEPEKMYNYLMTELGDSTWHNNFSHVSSASNISSQGSLSWSDKYQPGYLFRNLGNENVHFNDQIIRLLQNYRSAYLQLAVHHYFKYQNLKQTKTTEDEAERERKAVLSVLDQMALNLPEKTIPIPSIDLYYQIGQIYSQVGEKDRFRTILDKLSSRERVSLDNKIRFGQTYIQELKDYDKAINIFEEMNSHYRSLEESYRKNPNSVSAKSWNKWGTVYPEIISSLILAYQGVGDDKKAELVLNDWLERNPTDNTARKMLDDLNN